MANENIQEVGLKFKADGSVDYIKSLKEIRQEQDQLYADYVRENAEMDKNATATEKLTAKKRMLEQQLESQRQKVYVLNHELEAMSSAEEKDEAAIAKKRKELTYAEAKLADYEKGLKSAGDELKKHSQWTDQASKSLKDFGSKTEEFGKKVSVASAGAAAIGGAAIASFNEVDGGMDIIITKTGATGEALAGLGDSYKAVFGSMPTTAEKAGTAVGEVNARFNATGKELENLSADFLRFAEVNGNDLNTSIGKTQKIMSQWDVQTKDTASVLGLITSESQRTGVSVDKLMDSVQANGATFKEMGLTLAQSIRLLANFEENGVNADAALAAMRKSAVSYTKEGLTLEQGLQKTIASIKSASSETEALAIAQATFGSKGALEMVSAIREGRISVDDLSSSLEGMGTVVQDTFEATLDAPDKLTVALNNAKLAGADLGEAIFTALTPMIDMLVESMKNLTSWFTSLDEGQKQTIVTILGIVAVLGPLLIIFGKIISAIGSILFYWPMLSAMFTDLIAKAMAFIATPVGMVLAGIAAAAALAYTAFKIFAADTESAKESLKNFAADAPSLTEALNGVKPSIADVNSLLSATGKTVSQLDSAIKESENAITETLATALSEHRALRQEELDSIRQHNDELLALQAEKLQLYRDQQIAELRKLQLEEDTITQETALQRISNAQAALDQTNAITEQAYTARLSIIENKHKAMNDIGSAAYQAELEQAKAHYDASISENQSYYSQALATATDGAAKWIATDKDKWDRLNSGQKISAKEFKNIIDELNGENTKMFLQMVATTKAEGGEISAETENTARMMLAAFDGLPKDMKNAGTESLRGLLSGMEDKLPALKDMSNMTGDEIINALRSVLDIHSPSRVLKDLGQDAGQGLIDGLSSKKDSAGSTASSIGGNIVQGIWSGITSFTNWLYSRVSGWVDDVIGWIKNLFGIHSPSSVMEKQVGLPLVQGIAAGITKYASLVGDAMARINPGSLSFAVAAKAIPMMAAGGSFVSGMAIVAEAGPELITASAGRTVVTPLSNRSRNSALGALDLSEETISRLTSEIIRVLRESGALQFTVIADEREVARYVAKVVQGLA